MLKTILSVSGKPGLFRLISSAKNMVIVESLADQRRIPIHARDKVVSLGDIAMYTNESEVPLNDILVSIHKKEEGKEVTPLSKSEDLRAYFAEVLPDYDRDRVYDSDIKKLISWYNLLIKYGFSISDPVDTTVEVDSEIVEEPKEEIQEKPVKKSKPKAEK